MLQKPDEFGVLFRISKWTKYAWAIRAYLKPFSMHWDALDPWMMTSSKTWWMVHLTKAKCSLIMIFTSICLQICKSVLPEYQTKIAVNRKDTQVMFSFNTLWQKFGTWNTGDTKCCVTQLFLCVLKQVCGYGRILWDIIFDVNMIRENKSLNLLRSRRIHWCFDTVYLDAYFHVHICCRKWPRRSSHFGTRDQAFGFFTSRFPEFRCPLPRLLG